MSLRLLPFFMLLLVAATPASAVPFETAARSAILLDYRNDEVLYAKNADEPLPPASMSKLMTALMVFDRLKEGSLNLEDELPVSEKAWRTGGSKMFVEVGSRVSIDDLLQGIIVQSGNDACVVVAEGLAGTEEAFAARMNERARELGLTASHFENATGLDHPEQRMSVRDLAILARVIIRDYPNYFHYYSQREFTFSDITQGNRNPLLQAGVPGVDGMKTGHTSQAGYGLVATAERDGRRLILVIAGLESQRQRRAEGERLLEYGFRDFREFHLYAAGESVVEAPVWLGSARTVPLVGEEPIAVTLAHDARKSLRVTLRYEEPVLAPIEKGQVLGELEIAADGKETRTVPLVAGEDVERAGLFGRITGVVSHLVWGGSS